MVKVKWAVEPSSPTYAYKNISIAVSRTCGGIELWL